MAEAGRLTPHREWVEWRTAQRLGRPLAEWVTEQRAGRRSWRDLAALLLDATGVSVSWETLRVWYPDQPGGPE